MTSARLGRAPADAGRLHRDARWSLVATALLGLFACGDAVESITPSREPSTDRQPSSRPTTAQSPREDLHRPPLARVVRVDGLSASAFHAGQRLGPTATLSTGESALVLELREGSRVTLEPRTVARLGQEAPAQLILGAGIVHVEQRPEDDSRRAPLRIATSAGSIVIEGAGDVWVATDVTGRTFATTLQGRATAEVSDESGALRATEVLAGRSLSLGDEATRQGPSDADAARAAARHLLDAASLTEAARPLGGATPTEAAGDLDVASPIEAARALDDASPTEAARDLDAARAALFSALEAAEAEARMPAEPHANAPPPAGSAEATERPHAPHELNVALRSRRRLLLRYERLRALALVASWQGHQDDPSATLRPRVRSALGLEAD